jgi:hypothetical protein
MRKCQLLLLLLIVVLVAVAVPSAARYGDDEYYYPDNIPHANLRAGAFFPSGDTIDSSEFFAGVEYEYPISRLSRGALGHLTLTLDYTEITSRRVINSIIVQENVSLIPLLLNYKRRTISQDIPLYFTVGLGMYIADEPIPEMQLDNGASFAWQIMFGTEFDSGVFLEARYLAGTSPGDDGLAALTLGFHY